MSKSKKLVFFGTEDFSATSLTTLIHSGFDIAAVVTKPDSKAGRGQKIIPPAVAKSAKTAGIKLLQPADLKSISSELKATGAEAAVLVSYGKLIPQSIIDLFPLGIINVHPSLLPRYRGPSPVETVIVNGDKTTGVSLMKLTAGMDEGPVYVQKAVEVFPGATGPLLSDYLARVGAEMLQKHLAKILSGELNPAPQNDQQASYTKLLKKSDGWTDFTEPADKLERKIRAYKSYPRTRANIQNHEVVITEARVAKNADDGVLVRICDPGYLEIHELIAPSGRRMSGADFLRGYTKQN